jgi:hypothetical protein
MDIGKLFTRPELFSAMPYRFLCSDVQLESVKSIPQNLVWHQ